MAKVRITYTKSKIGSTERQKKTIEALGLGKLNSSVEKDSSPQVLGMIRKVNHLVKVEEI